MANLDPYDELPYRSRPIEWTAPERLALASMLHGGPRGARENYRVLELGCADGANLLPLAFHRRHSTFVGVDGALTQISIADANRSLLRLSNVEFIHADFLTAEARLEGRFDYIIAHGVFSWVPEAARDALLRLCSARLRDGGLLYLNYNSNPGWKVRGMIRDFLLAHTESITGLRRRAESAREVSTTIVASLSDNDHPYSRLIADEFRFVAGCDLSYIAHEYLAVDNRPYWRAEFIQLVERYGLEFVADADFNYPSGRVPENLGQRLTEERISGFAEADTVDFLCYRQLHSPILAKGPVERRPPNVDEFACLTVASCLAPCEQSIDGMPMFRHPSGYTVEAKNQVIKRVFDLLAKQWPDGLRIDTVFSDLDEVVPDLTLLFRNGLIDLRLPASISSDVDYESLRRFENDKRGHFTTPYHTQVNVVECT